MKLCKENTLSGAADFDFIVFSIFIQIKSSLRSELLIWGFIQMPLCKTLTTNITVIS